MKNTVAFSATLLCFLLIVQSCSKKSQDSIPSLAQPDQLITATVNSGETYTLIVGNSGTLNISRQALHFQVSATSTDNGSVLYKYTPETGYFGSDEVALMYSPTAAPPEQDSGCPSHGTGMSTSSTIIVKFTVDK
jgi:hypothetical protein